MERLDNFTLNELLAAIKTIREGPCPDNLHPSSSLTYTTPASNGSENYSFLYYTLKSYKGIENVLKPASVQLVFFVYHINCSKD